MDTPRISRAPRAPAAERMLALLRENSAAALILVALALMVHTVFAESGYLAMRRIQGEIELLRRELAELHAHNQRLAAEVHALKTDPQTIERIAREEMGLAKPGELIFRLPARPGAPPRDPQPEDPPQRPDEPLQQ